MQNTHNFDDQAIAWTPTDDVIERSRLRAFMRSIGVSTWDELYAHSINDVEMYTAEVLEFLDIKFEPPYDKLLDTTDGIAFPKWCANGGLNITTMCLDRWVDKIGDQPAVIWEGEEGGTRTLTYSELLLRVRIVAEKLEHYGFQKGDAIGIHLPMMMETVVTLLAINRIGAIAVPVFSGYGIEAIASRLNAVKAKGLFTCDGFPRRDKPVNALETALEAVRACPTIDSSAGPKVFVVDRLHDLFVENAEAPYGDGFVPYRLAFDYLSGDGHAEPTLAEDPLIILYTSGTTGKPKGITHTHASFPIKAAQDMAFGTDVGVGTRISWYTDIGWMMGPWLIYGALINGGTICIYDGAPDYPTPDRMWEFCAKQKVEILGISPTLVRSLSNCGDDLPKKHDLSSLRAFASTGEPWNPAPWWWLFEKVGDSKLPIINYSGGTEIAGGILMGNPLLPIKPCSFPAPCPGMDVDILDEEGKPVEPGKVGELVIKQPWIGMARGFWQEKERYLETYWRRFKNIWVHGDWAMRDKDGHWFILGRSDDTLKVAGKRVGPAEVESILVSHPQVTEAAVIGIPDEAKGTAMVAFVVRNADTLVGNPAEGRTTAATFENKKGWHERGYLPHFDGVVTQFVTFRLGDSLPQNVLKGLQAQLEADKLSDNSDEYRQWIDDQLDAGIGECIMKKPEIAEIVAQCILYEADRSCRIFSWVIMPNHVHLLLRTNTGISISDIMKRIKGVSARRINEALGGHGRIWQPDYFDRFIRDGEHWAAVIRYIENNPVKAGLCARPEDWKFSSACASEARSADKSARVPLEDELKQLVATQMGKPLAPSKVHFVSALPKTRNAKVMRRVIRSAYLGEDAGDLSSLENPATVDEIAACNKRQ